MTNNEDQKKTDWKALAKSVGKDALDVAKVLGKAAVDGAVAAGKALDAQMEDNALMGRRDGYFETYAPATTAFEAIMMDFSTAHIEGNTGFWWRNIKPIPDYMLIDMDASWQSNHNGKINYVSLKGKLRFEQLDECCRIHFNYEGGGDGLQIPFLAGSEAQLIRLTNKSLRSVCATLDASHKP